MTKLELQVAQLVRKELGLSQVPTLDQDFEDDLGGDSLDTIEIIMETEKAFNVDIPDEDAFRTTTVRKLVAVLVRRANLVNE